LLFFLIEQIIWLLKKQLVGLSIASSSSRAFMPLTERTISQTTQSRSKNQPIKITDKIEPKK
jgi:hypothetical protein